MGCFLNRLNSSGVNSIEGFPDSNALLNLALKSGGSSDNMLSKMSRISRFISCERAVSAADQQVMANTNVMQIRLQVNLVLTIRFPVKTMQFRQISR